jgi:hypothetical protein
MNRSDGLLKNNANRRSFLKNGMIAVGAVTASAGLLTGEMSAFGQEGKRDGDDLSKGDAAILQLLLAAEIIETDLWQQYRELRHTSGETVTPRVEKLRDKFWPVTADFGM